MSLANLPATYLMSNSKFPRTHPLTTLVFSLSRELITVYQIRGKTHSLALLLPWLVQKVTFHWTPWCHVNHQQLLKGRKYTKEFSSKYKPAKVNATRSKPSWACSHNPLEMTLSERCVTHENQHSDAKGYRSMAALGSIFPARSPEPDSDVVTTFMEKLTVIVFSPFPIR